MSLPPLAAWIEEADKSSCPWRIERGEISSLGAIADQACPTQIGQRRCPAVPFGDNVIRLIWEEGIGLVEQTVLAVSACSVMYLAPQEFWDPLFLSHLTLRCGSGQATMGLRLHHPHEVLEVKIGFQLVFFVVAQLASALC